MLADRSVSTCEIVPGEFMTFLLAAQAGTLYGLWGTLLVAYGIVFSSVIDLLGKYTPLSSATAVCCSPSGDPKPMFH